MIRAEPAAWQTMLKHALGGYPRECCGILLGREEPDGERVVTEAVACRNAYEGDQSDRFLIDPSDQLAAGRRACAAQLDVIGFFHSHPDKAAYWSDMDLQHSWPQYSNIVLSIVRGRFATAAAFRSDSTCASACQEELVYPDVTGENLRRIP